MWTRENDKHQLLTQTCTTQTTSWLACSLSAFGVTMSHGQTQTRNIHHGPDLGEAITFPLIIFFVFGHGANIQMSFCPGIPKWESQNSQS
jgi:hypothetical protein